MAAQMVGVSTAGNNLANVNPPGYSRQRVNLETSAPLTGASGQVSNGVDATSVQRIVDDLLNGRIQTQNGVQAYWTAQQTVLQNAETGMNESLSGTGSTDTSNNTATATNANASLSAQLSNFFSAAQAITQPGGNTATNRDLLVKAAQSVAASFNNASAQLASARTSVNTMLGNDVSTANTLLTNIANLNQQITDAEAGGGTANDLRDQRDQALQNLGQVVNFTTSTSANGEVNVTVGGQTLVSGQNVQDTLQTYDAGGGQLLLRTTTSAAPVTVTSGSIAGEITARDTTLASTQSGVDALAASFIAQVNAVQATGFTVNGTTGNNFFTGTDAGTIAVNPALANNSELVQISGSATAAGDSSVAQALGQLANATQSALGNQTFSQAYAQVVGNLGSDLQTANNQVASQATVSSMLSAQQKSVSGVSTDEEMTSLLSYQQAYNASAEVLKTINAMLTTTIGMVS